VSSVADDNVSTISWELLTFRGKGLLFRTTGYTAGKQRVVTWR